MRATTEPTMKAALSDLAELSHRGTEAVPTIAEPANDRPAASLSMHPTAGKYALLAARCAGYDVSLRDRQAAGSGNFEKRPRGHSRRRSGQPGGQARNEGDE